MGDVIQFKAKTPVTKAGDDGKTTTIRIQIHLNMGPEKPHKTSEEKTSKREMKVLGFWTGVIAALTLLFSGIL